MIRVPFLFFYVVFKSYPRIDAIFNAGKSFYFPFFLDRYTLSMLSLWSTCWNSSLVYFQSCTEYLTSEADSQDIHPFGFETFLQPSEIILFLIFLFYLHLFDAVLFPVFPITLMIPFLILSRFNTSIFPLFVFSHFFLIFSLPHSITLMSLLESLWYHRYLMFFHWSLCERMSPQISKTLLKPILIFIISRH